MYSFYQLVQDVNSLGIDTRLWDIGKKCNDQLSTGAIKEKMRQNRNKPKSEIPKKYNLKMS